MHTGLKIQRQVIGAILLIMASVQADVISVNFARLGWASTPINTNVFTGVVSDLTWTNIYTESSGGTGVNAVNLDGSTLDIVSSPYVYSSTVTNWNGWANVAGLGLNSATNSFTLTLSDIPYTNYYIIAYVCGFAAGAGSISDGTTTYAFNMLNLTTKPSLVQLTAANSGGSYAVFGSDSNPLTGTSQTLTFSETASTVILGGFQVVQVIPEPASLGLFVVGTGLCWLKRKMR